VDEFGAENLQTLLQSFDLVLDIFFDGGKFVKTITDVNVHSASALLTKCATKCFLSRIVHPAKKASGELHCFVYEMFGFGTSLQENFRMDCSRRNGRI
jgi:hypothetical protein